MNIAAQAPHRAKLLLALLSASCLFGCGRASSRARLLPLPALPAPTVQRLAITVPVISLTGDTVVVSAKGLVWSLSLENLVNVDNGFLPAGAGGNTPENFAVVRATIKGLFAMGYFDELGPLSQSGLDGLLEGVRFTEPIRVAAPALGRGSLWDVAAISGNAFLGAVELAQGPSGLGIEEVVHETATSGVASLLDSFPALTSAAAENAVGGTQFGFSVGSLTQPPLERVALPFPHMGGPLGFFWLPKGCQDGTAVSSSGRLFHFDLPRQVDDLTEGSLNAVSLTEVGKVAPLPQERKELEK